MAPTPSNGKIAVAQLLIPVSLTAFVLCLVLAFQATQIMRDHTALQGASAGQEQQLGQARKVQSQLEALALGTKKLADQGDKDAEAIIARMQQSGISVGNTPSGTAPAGAPSAPPAGASPAPPAPPAP